MNSGSAMVLSKKIFALFASSREKITLSYTSREAAKGKHYEQYASKQ